ncbi:two-component system, OmpR family, response regulator RstA [Formivibrio citricus]|uniref:Two-component system, OmpR family, response regulator RstA n=1 Tax=Formivibrio citricus TaxID=83765 RepID=A0A1I5CSD2_9NEIS|nr:winged helix-turn-helix domain-containing protein [Formivibrio citricus]SFN89889.1 two-component system, OmpR family, response regulator RstA [Formivibrio citricus]
MSNRILFVEDDPELAELIGGFLRSFEFTVEVMRDGIGVVEAVRANPPALVLLDIMLPGKDGLTVCRELREFYFAPIILLTSLNSDMNQILGFEIGASDYVVKTTPPSVLLARIRAQLRQGLAAPVQPAAKPAEKSTLNFGKLVIDSRNRTANYRGEPLHLSTGDFDLLWELSSHAGEILSRDHLLRKLRGIDYDGLDRSMDVAISRLRKKLGDDPEDPRKIKTIRHRGYLFATDVWWQE